METRETKRMKEEARMREHMVFENESQERRNGRSLTRST